jgi:hypothetical protein
MKSVYSAVRTGSLNKAVCASSLRGYFTVTFCVHMSLAERVHGRLTVFGNIVSGKYTDLGRRKYKAARKKCKINK